MTISAGYLIYQTITDHIRKLSSYTGLPSSKLILVLTFETLAELWLPEYLVPGLSAGWLEEGDDFLRKHLGVGKLVQVKALPNNEPFKLDTEHTPGFELFVKIGKELSDSGLEPETTKLSLSGKAVSMLNSIAPYEIQGIAAMTPDQFKQLLLSQGLLGIKALEIDEFASEDQPLYSISDNSIVVSDQEVKDLNT